MKRAGIVAALAALFLASAFLALASIDRIIPVLGPILPHPDGVPRTASAHFSSKDGVYWTWKRSLGGGCLAWMAMDDWGSVQVIVNKPCRAVSDQDDAETRGFSYLSVDKDLLFTGYWPWPAGIYDKLIVYDEAGMFQRTLACPHSLTPSAVAEMRAAMASALSQRLTAAERRTLTYVAKRLDRMNGKALASRQNGCSDWTGRDDVSGKVDTWKDDGASDA